jgi:hypothetical protein
VTVNGYGVSLCGTGNVLKLVLVMTAVFEYTKTVIHFKWEHFMPHKSQKRC